MQSLCGFHRPMWAVSSVPAAPRDMLSRIGERTDPGKGRQRRERGEIIIECVGEGEKEKTMDENAEERQTKCPKCALDFKQIQVKWV